MAPSFPAFKCLNVLLKYLNVADRECRERTKLVDSNRTDNIDFESEPKEKKINFQFSKFS